MASAVVGTMFISGVALADTPAAQPSSAEVSTTSDVTPAQPETTNGQPGSTTQVQPTEPQVDTSAETFSKRLDAIEAYIKEDVANNLNESLTTAVDSYNSIDGNTKVADTPKVTADDVTLTYDRSKFELTEDYKFTKKPVTISYNLNNKDYTETYAKIQPAFTTVKNVVADPIIVGTTPKKASEPKAIDDNNTMMSVARGSRQINYSFEGTGNTALTSIKQFVSFYSPFVTPKEVHNQLSPKTDKKQAKETRFETTEGVSIKEAVKGFVEAPTVIEKYQYTGNSKLNDKGDILTYFYTVAERNIPNDAPVVDKPEYKEDPKPEPKPEPASTPTPEPKPEPKKEDPKETPKDEPKKEEPKKEEPKKEEPKKEEPKKEEPKKEEPKKEEPKKEESKKEEPKKEESKKEEPKTESKQKTTVKPSTSVEPKKQLPNTGTAKSALSVVGAIVLGLGFVLRKKEQK